MSLPAALHRRRHNAPMPVDRLSPDADDHHMQRALQLAESAIGLTEPNPREAKLSGNSTIWPRDRRNSPHCASRT